MREPLAAMKDPRPIYLDYQATTPCDPAVIEAMVPWLGERFGNAASRMHAYGLEADALVESARETIARWIGAASPQEVVFTSGATESNNIALIGAVAASGESRRHLVISALEHEAVMDPAEWLAERGGCSLSVVPPAPEGRIDPEAVAAALRDDTLIVSVMHANNVVGSVSDIAAIGEICRKRGVLFHTDAAQSVGKVPFDVEAMNVDLASVSAHKVYGPKGMGFLYVRRRPARTRLEPIMRGGGQENGLRPGTLPVALIAGLEAAARIADEGMSEEAARLTELRGRLLGKLMDGLEGVKVNGTLEPGWRLPGNLNLSFEGIEIEELLVTLRSQVAISAGSACASTGSGPSRVLLAMGVDPKEAAASMRLGLGRFTTEEEIDTAAAAIVEAVSSIRERRSG